MVVSNGFSLDVAVIPGRAQREPQMCNCTSGNLERQTRKDQTRNLEIPGSMLRIAPE